MRELIEKIANGKTLAEFEESELATKIKRLFEEHPSLQIKHRRWKKIISWVSGYQDAGEFGKKTPLIQKKRKERHLVFNRLRPFLRTMLAKLCSVNPQLGVIPNTDEPQDIEAARLADIVVEYLTSENNFQKLRRTLFQWLLLTNHAYVRVYWNLAKKGLIGWQDQIALNEAGEEVGRAKIAIYEEGDVSIEAVSPFHCFPDPVFSDNDSWRWFIFVELVDAYDLAKHYDVDVEDLSEENVDRFKQLNSLESSAQISEMEDPEFSFSSAELKDDYGKAVLKIEFWTPEVFAFMVGNKLLEYGQNPYGQIPFFGFEDQLIPIDFGSITKPLNDSIIRDLIPIQREYNRFVSILSENLENFSKSKVMIPLHGVVNKQAIFDDEKNLVLIHFDPRSGTPFQLRLDQLHPQTAIFKQEIERELEFVSGIHEVSFARLPERASHASGTLVSLLLEQDDQTLDYIIRAIDEMLAKALKLGLQIIQDNYTVSRIIKVVGSEKVPEIISFKGSDIRGNTDVRVSTQLGLPRSRILRAEWILRLAQTGLIQDPKLILELLEFGQVRKLFEDVLAHEKKAMRENLEIEKNAEINPIEFHQRNFYEFDADDIHFKIHLRERLSPKFEQYTENQKQALEHHLRAHRLRLLEAQTPPAQQVPPALAGQASKPENMGLPADFLAQLLQGQALTPETGKIVASGEIPEQPETL